MKFIYNLYVLIIILRSTWVVQNSADFTIDELKHLSQKLSPIECMRLLEAIYLAISSEKGHRFVKETPVNTWISKHACLDELKAWNYQFPDKTEPRARLVMILHLNALGRRDLANYVHKNRKALSVFGNVVNRKWQFQEENEQNSGNNHRIFKRNANKRRPDHRSRFKRITRRIKRTNTSKKINPMNAAITGEALNNDGQAPPDKNETGKWKQALSKNTLYLVIALGLVVIFICAIVFLILRRSFASSLCLGECRNLYRRNNGCMEEKGLQFIGCLDDQDDYETQSSKHSQNSEIDVEGESCIHSVGVDCRKSFSDTNVLSNERITPARVSIEKPQLSEEEPMIEVLKEPRPLGSSRCCPLKPKICAADCKPVKKKKRKVKVKSKEKTKTAKCHFESKQEKILPRQDRQLKKDCNFDTKQFQDKILTILNQECGVCQCCNCIPHWEVDGSRVKNDSARHEERPVKQEKRELRGKQSKKEKRKKLSVTIEGDDNGVLAYRASVTSRSPMSGERLSRKQETDGARKSKMKDSLQSGKFARSSRMKRIEDRKDVSPSSSEMEVSNDKAKRRKGHSRINKGKVPQLLLS